jgi:hypothetical protein
MGESIWDMNRMDCRFLSLLYILQVFSRASFGDLGKLGKLVGKLPGVLEFVSTIKSVGGWISTLANSVLPELRGTVNRHRLHVYRGADFYKVERFKYEEGRRSCS